MNGWPVGWLVGWVGRTSSSANGNGLDYGLLGISCSPLHPSSNADPGNEIRIVAFSTPSSCRRFCACFALLRPGQGKVTHNPIRRADLLHQTTGNSLGPMWSICFRAHD